MIRLLFKKCGPKAKKKPTKPDHDGPERIVRELLPGLVEDVGDPAAPGRLVFVTDAHFASLSVAASRRVPKNGAENVLPKNGADNVLPKNGARVADEHLESLQCPFTWRLWDADPSKRRHVAGRVCDKYGEHNTAIRTASARFSFEKYICNLIISCGLTEQNQAHDNLIDIWGWLDELDDKHEPFYVAIRDGLKHIVMSTLCHILYNQDKAKYRQLFRLTTRFNSMRPKSRAAVYAVRAAVCVEYGGDETLNDAVEYATRACDLDPDTAQWNYYRSVSLTARRQHLHTCKSCPADAEFDAVQRAIISANVPNAYYNFHRMVLMKNKILYRYRYDNRNNRNNVVKSVSSEQAQRDFHNVVELIKEIVFLEPEDPHLVVKCAKSLLTMPYLSQDNVYVAKQIITIAINMGFNDPTVIEAINDTIDTYRRLVDIYREMHEQKTHAEGVADVRDLACRDGDGSVENNLRTIADKCRKGGEPMSDLIGLLDKHDGRDRWQITAQICSYSILCGDPANRLVAVVERFSKLIDDRAAANSDVVKNHRSLFAGDRSKAFNLAELVCNEIKTAVAFGRVKDPDETRFCLDQLTEIAEVCRLKSKRTDADMVAGLLTECGDGEPVQRTVPRLVDAFNRQCQLRVPVTEQTAPRDASKRRRRRTSKRNKCTRAVKSKPRRNNDRHQ